ncbi:MAG TPA: SpoIIE family protein phosphatase [Candidatus Limnocylindria bacterium]|nr:SpoIIE family protein phosphatase [Candidatus Limnocylindria bacterium]
MGSLKTRLRWSYALVSVIPLALLGALLIAFSLAEQRQDVAQEQQTTANWVAREIGASLSSVDEQLLRFGPHLGPERSTAELAAAIAVLRATVPDIIDVAVLDETGKERVHLSQLRGFHDSELVDRSGNPLVYWTLRTGRVAQGSVSLQQDGTLVYPSYAPIFGDTGRVVGAIRVEVRAAYALRTLREAPLPQDSVAYLVNSSGSVLFSTTDGTERAAPAGLSSRLVGQASSGEYRNGAGTPVIGALSPVPVQPYEWWVLVEAPRSVTYAPIWRDGLLLLAAVALVIVTTIGWGIYQTGLVLRPLDRLRAAAVTIGTGDLAARIPVRDHDEIGALADEFNRMAEHLQASRARIEQQNQDLRQGLTLARDIQLGLLPAAPPREMSPLVLRGYSDPAYEVGGDFYTYLALDEHRMAVALGDISGKGVGAALMMALVMSTVEAQGRAIARPEQLLTALNQQLSGRLMANRMNAALLYATIDMEQATLSVANAGMNPPYLLRDGRVQRVDARGFPLGPMPDIEYGAATIDILPGDLLLLVSDGVVEAHRPGGELFGFKRVEQFLGEHNPDLPPDDLISGLLDRVNQFVEGAEQHDDITVVVIQPNLPLVATAREPLPALAGVA